MMKDKTLRRKAKLGFSALFAGALTAFAAPAMAAEAQDFLQRAEEAANRGERLSAIQLFQSAIIYAPKTIEPYLGIADFYAQTDEPALAEIYYGMALGLEPANPPALKGLGLVALARGDIEEAAANHEILLEACAPRCPEAAELRTAINQSGADPAVAVD